jgi:Zn-dependent protease
VVDETSDVTPTTVVPRGPSPIFLGLLALLAVTGWLAWIDAGAWSIFLFVTTGWVVSLCLHEFAHAAVAYVGGDRSVAEKGYLTLDVRRYADPGLSLVLPVIFVVMGGIGLPGGAVWIDHGSLRNRWVDSAACFAGPAANVLVALLCLVPLGLGWVETDVQLDLAGFATNLDRLDFAAGLAFLGFLQLSAVLLNLLPVPGLDGFAMLDPHLPTDLRVKARRVGRWGFLVVIGLLLLPGPNEVFFGLVDDLVALTGTPSWLPSEGYYLYRFWEL